VLLEQRPLLVFGDATAKVLRRQDRADEECGVRPVEDVQVQRVLATALGIDAFDVPVVVAHLPAGLVRTVAVEHHATSVTSAIPPTTS